jgi:hypothetical protein
MKKIAMLIAASILSFNIIAGNDNPERGDKYCAKMKAGKIVMMHSGIELTKSVTLTNGTTIKPDGTIMKKDGTTWMLKNEECVNTDGKAIEPKMEKKAEPKMEPQKESKTKEKEKTY